MKLIVTVQDKRYQIVSGSRPTCFSVYKHDGKVWQWITQATLLKGKLQGVEDNKAFSAKAKKEIRKAVVAHIMTL